MKCPRRSTTARHTTSLHKELYAGADQLLRGVRGPFGFQGPRITLLFAAGVELCRGNVAAARRLFERSELEYGDGGLGR